MMLRYFLISEFTLSLFLVNAQSYTDVYSCTSINPIVTQAEIDATSDFHQQCVEFSGTNYLFNGSSNHTVTAANEIRLQSGFHAGEFNFQGQMHLRIAPSDQMEIVSINYSDLNIIKRYEKFELGVKLPDDILTKVNNFLFEENVPNTEKINPFLSWQLKVQATFTHVSGAQKTIEGFYYREIQRDEVNDSWTDLGTDFPFRIRFAPPLNGKWSCVVKIFVLNQLSNESSAFSFNTIESGNPGYVKVHPNQKNLMRGNEIIFPVGHNFPSPFIDNTTQWASNFPITHESALVWKSFLNDIQHYSDLGGKFYRFIITPYNSDIEFEELGDYYNRLDYAWEIDNMINLSEDNKMLIDFNLMLQSSICLSSSDGHAWDFANLPNEGFDVSPKYCYGPAFNVNKMSEAINSPNLVDNHTAMDFLKQRYRYLISRWGYSTSIYMFELASEPWHMDEEVNNIPYSQNNVAGSIVRQTVQLYHSELSEFIKIDLNRQEHLLSANGRYINNLISHSGGDFTINDESWALPYIDVISFNPYSAGVEKYYKNSEDNFNGFVYRLNQIYNKPIIVSETSGVLDDCSSYSSFRADISLIGFTGIAGFQIWPGFNKTSELGIERSFLWGKTIKVQDRMNSQEVVNVLSNGNGNWEQKSILEPDHYLLFNLDVEREMHYYISADKRFLVGSLYNRTYNYFTKSNGGNCSNSDYNGSCDNLKDVHFINDARKLYLNGLMENHNYESIFHTDRNHDLGFKCQDTDHNGNLTLKHPTMYVEQNSIVNKTETPLIWFDINQSNCKSLEVEYSDPENSSSFFFGGTIKVNSLLKELEVFSDRANYGTIYTSEGKIVCTFSIEPGYNLIGLDHLSSGLYIVNIYNEKFKCFLN